MHGGIKDEVLQLQGNLALVGAAGCRAQWVEAGGVAGAVWVRVQLQVQVRVQGRSRVAGDPHCAQVPSRLGSHLRTTCLPTLLHTPPSHAFHTLLTGPLTRPLYTPLHMPPHTAAHTPLLTHPHTTPHTPPLTRPSPHRSTRKAADKVLSILQGVQEVHAAFHYAFELALYASLRVREWAG